MGVPFFGYPRAGSRFGIRSETLFQPLSKFHCSNNNNGKKTFFADSKKPFSFFQIEIRLCLYRLFDCITGSSDNNCSTKLTINNSSMPGSELYFNNIRYDHNKSELQSKTIRAGMHAVLISNSFVLFRPVILFCYSWKQSATTIICYY